MIIKSVEIQKFRDIENISLDIGSKVTFIAGSNGTSKTSLLGLIAQPFSFKDKVLDNKKQIEVSKIVKRTITQKSFETKFGDIHNFTEYDDIVSIKYKLVLDENQNGIEIPVEGEYRDKTAKIGMRFVAFPDEREAGKGNYKFPVIYLGLKRLHPLGEHSEKDVKITKPQNITEEEKTLYNNYHRELFIDTGINFEVEDVKALHKQMLGGKNAQYDTNGFSAGQDNISQIITAILSFRRLKNELGGDYKGGLLLIDEIEATLHPITQEQLIQTLYKIARDYKLQVIVTTHSLEILKLGMQKKYEKDTEIVYLTKTRGPLQYWPTASFTEIQEDMTAQIFRPRVHKTQILCEDDEAVAFLANILPKDTKSKVDIISTKLGHGQLTNLAGSPISKNNNFIFVLDGDQKKPKRSNRILILPGNDSPEALIYQMLDTMPEADIFFEKPKPAKNVYFRNFANIPPKGDKNAEGLRREWLKGFFAHLKSDINATIWNTLFKKWISLNKTSTEQFVSEFTKTLEALKV